MEVATKGLRSVREDRLESFTADLLGACAMPFARYFCGQWAGAFAGAIIAALLALGGEPVCGQERQVPQIPQAPPSKSSSAPAAKTESPASTKPASAAPSAKGGSNAATPSANNRLTFNFRYQPWQEVLDW